MPSDMKTRLLTGAVLMLVVACAAPLPPRPPPQTSAFGVQVAAEHSGSIITLEREQTLLVRLATNVSQNREWSLVDFVPGVLTGPAAPVFERDPRGSNFDGTSGAAVWHFKPAAAGTVTLKFEYRHPRTLAPAIQTVNYTITVR